MHICPHTSGFVKLRTYNGQTFLISIMLQGASTRSYFITWRSFITHKQYIDLSIIWEWESRLIFLMIQLWSINYGLISDWLEVISRWFHLILLIGVFIKLTSDGLLFVWLQQNKYQYKWTFSHHVYAFRPPSKPQLNCSQMAPINTTLYLYGGCTFFDVEQMSMNSEH